MTLRKNLTLVFVVACLFAFGRQVGHAQTFTNGDVFVAIGSGSVQWRRANGNLVKTLVSTVPNNVFTTGMAFDTAGQLYVTMFSSQAISVFNDLGVFTGTFGSGYDLNPESIVFDRAGNAYVGHADGSGDVFKFDSAGGLVNRFDVAREDRGSDWVDLASDQCTIFYTSEDKNILRYDVCANQQLSDFTTTELPGSHAYALRILPNDDVLVADSESILRLDDLGNVIQSYDSPGNDNWFALNIDPDGRSFWSADLVTADVAKFDISSGEMNLGFNAGAAGFVGGITVKGEITAAQTPRTGLCVTRSALYWFTHPSSENPNCATLKKALEANIGGVSLGFMRLPSGFRNDDNVRDVEDALIEALGLYWRSKSRTGEIAGSQDQKQPASKLCRRRKSLAIELIAATANLRLLGTDPADCGFSSDLIRQSRRVAASDNIDEIRATTALLKRFNSSGLTNAFTAGLVECDGLARRELRRMSLDPTLQATCPGINDACTAAESVFKVPLQRRVDLSTFKDDVQDPPCAAGGPDAVFKIAPPVAAVGRHFTVEMSGANFEPLLSVWQGTCSNLIALACDSTNGFGSARVDFRTDGTNTVFIVIEGKDGAVGNGKLRFTSP